MLQSPLPAFNSSLLFVNCLFVYFSYKCLDTQSDNRNEFVVRSFCARAVPLIARFSAQSRSVASPGLADIMHRPAHASRCVDYLSCNRENIIWCSAKQCSEAEGLKERFLVVRSIREVHCQSMQQAYTLRYSFTAPPSQGTTLSRTLAGTQSVYIHLNTPMERTLQRTAHRSA